MQPKMRDHQLGKDQIDALLTRLEAGTLSVNGASGFPYAVPLHFVYDGGNIYVHCRANGQKTDFILNDQRVCFTAYELKGYHFDESKTACGTGSAYESVIITGNARIVEDCSKKEQILMKIGEKYCIESAGKKIPENMLNMTCVIELVPVAVTGKYHD